MNFLFHSEVFMPAKFNARFETTLKYGRHAVEAASNDRYGKVDLPAKFDSACATLVEVETDSDSKVLKKVYRVCLDATRDLVMVIQPDGFVRTVWVNLRTDKHRSLDRTRYVRK